MRWVLLLPNALIIFNKEGLAQTQHHQIKKAYKQCTQEA